MGLGLTTERRTFLGKIHADGKIPENTSPGPAAYEFHQAKLMNIKRVEGGYVAKQKRQGFIDRANFMSSSTQCPSKYLVPDPSAHCLSNSPKYRIVGDKRFTDIKESPGAGKYDDHLARDAIGLRHERCRIGKAKKDNFTDVIIK